MRATKDTYAFISGNFSKSLVNLCHFEHKSQNDIMKKCFSQNELMTTLKPLVNLF